MITSSPELSQVYSDSKNYSLHAVQFFQGEDVEKCPLVQTYFVSSTSTSGGAFNGTADFRSFLSSPPNSPVVERTTCTDPPICGRNIELDWFLGNDAHASLFVVWKKEKEKFRTLD